MNGSFNPDSYRDRLKNNLFSRKDNTILWLENGNYDFVKSNVVHFGNENIQRLSVLINLKP